MDSADEIDDEDYDQPDNSDSEYEQSEPEPEQPDVEEDKTTEKAIEGDFDRLVKDSTLDWNFNIEEKEAEFRDDLRAATGIGRAKKHKGSRAAGPVLSQQVRSLIGDGNQAYVDENIPEAIRIMQEVIRIEPRAVSAWSVLAQCYEDMKQETKALQLRIMAAHLRHDADEWERLATQSRNLGLNQQALYCYRKLSSLDPANVNAWWERAAIAKEIGNLRTARHAYIAILKHIPHDLTVLSELRTVLVELGDLQTCATLFQQAFDHYHSTYPTGKGVTPSSGGIQVPGAGFTLLEILVLADLYNTLGEHHNAIISIKKGCRWLQGRAEQRYWSMCPDDREYDPPEDATTIRRPVQSQDSIEPGRYPIDVNARHRLAVARIKLGDIEEGKMHADIVLGQDVLDYAPLFAEIADAYFERELWAEAKPIYELLGSDETTSSLYILLQTAACLRMLDELKDAAEVYEHIKTADPTNNDVKMKLAEIYEILNEPRKALDLVYEVIDSRRQRRKDTTTSDITEDVTLNTGAGSLFTEKATKTSSNTRNQSNQSNRLDRTQLLQLEEEKEKEVTKGYKRCQELWDRMLKGDEEADKEWMIEADKLIETFRETRNLFTSTKSFRGMFPVSSKRKKVSEEDEDRMASRLQLDLENDRSKNKKSKNDAVNIFRGVTFDEWLKLFLQYCFNLVQRGQSALADEILRHILVSSAYAGGQLQDTIRIAIATIAIHDRKYNAVLEQCRKLMGVYQFNNEPFRMLLSFLASGLRPTDAFIASTLQKYLFREIKLTDAAVNNPETVKYNQMVRRWGPVLHGKIGDTADKDDDDESDGERGEGDRPELPTRPNPVIVALYGQICVAARSYQSALFYLLHAYDYCPTDPMVCLSLAIASVGRAMQRQSDNRHHLIAQAMAFLTHYRNLRGTSYEALSEVDYNFGRIFHQLGLFNHAVKHYENVLALAEKEPMKDKECGCCQEAAYNLAMIYVTTGATALADAIYRRWLSI